MNTSQGNWQYSLSMKLAIITPATCHDSGNPDILLSAVKTLWLLLLTSGIACLLMLSVLTFCLLFKHRSFHRSYPDFIY